MNKILCILMMILLVPTPSFARIKLRAGDNNRCFVNVKDTNRFWYCGTQDSTCAGKKLRKYHKRWWQYHGEGFDSGEGRHFWCCGGSTTAQGHYVETWDPFYSRETVTVDLPNGTCTYERITNVCGEVIDEPCTEPTECDAGLILRNGQCVAPCDGTTAFASKTSNECVECATTAYQGIDDKTSECVRCDSGTQFFDKKTKTCVSKTSSSLKKVTAATMKKCYGCPNSDVFKECTTLFSKSDTERRAAENYERIISECYIDDRPTTAASDE